MDIDNKFDIEVLDEDPFVEISRDFRCWCAMWDLYDTNPGVNKPISISKFIDHLKEKYELKYKSK